MRRLFQASLCITLSKALISLLSSNFEKVGDPQKEKMIYRNASDPQKDASLQLPQPNYAILRNYSEREKRNHSQKEMKPQLKIKCCSIYFCRQANKQGRKNGRRNLSCCNTQKDNFGQLFEIQRKCIEKHKKRSQSSIELTNIYDDQVKSTCKIVHVRNK